ncbi:MAG TPA: phosphoglycerate mutase family protein [Acidimicrobiales bacterium]
MTFFLVRHSHAGRRSDWDGKDEARPLSPRGEAQSAAIRDRLAATSVGRMVSSPYVRCLQTLEPAADRFGLTVEADERLAEGADPDEALELVLSLDPVNGVACSHGDVIPALLDRLAAMGMQTKGPLLHQKGSVWTIETDDGRPVRGRYRPPSA